MQPEPHSSRNGQHETATSLDERRSHERLSSSAKVHVTIEAQEIDGHCDNTSRAGVLFFSEHPLHVLVEIDDGEEKHRRHGRLVRVERMSAETTGYAVEFDELS